jgi:hypothetical protein
MKSIGLFFSVMLSAGFLHAQNELPYQQIPDYPDTYTPETVVARMIDGLGFRYYWATEGLRPEDLNFKPNEEARTSFETLQHIFGLSEVVIYPVKGEPVNRASGGPEMSFEALREATLVNLKTAADMLRSGTTQLEDCKIIFQRPNGNSEFPFWNNINGPIADAIWHTGQVVSFRRSSGNPFNSKVSVFQGKVRP